MVLILKYAGMFCAFIFQPDGSDEKINLPNIKRRHVYIYILKLKMKCPCELAALKLPQEWLCYKEKGWEVLSTQVEDHLSNIDNFFSLTF